MIRRTIPFVLAGLLVLTHSARAWADEPTESVTTKAGASYRGELVEKVPGDHVTIKLATGEIKRFAWDEIATPTVATPPAATPPPAPSATPAKTVHVVIQGDTQGVTLQRHSGSSTVIGSVIGGGSYSGSRLAVGAAEHYENVCTDTCDADIEVRETYRISYGSSPLYSSRTFVLPADRAKLTLTVDQGSIGARFGGATMLSIGVGGAITGLIGALILDDTGTRIGFAGMGVAGVVLAVLGVVVLNHSLTHVTDETGRELASTLRLQTAKAQPPRGSLRLLPNGFTF